MKANCISMGTSLLYDKCLVVISMMLGFVSVVSAKSGTAGHYVMRFPTACNQSDYQTNQYIAAASDILWDNGSVCGRLYNVTCIGTPVEGCSSFTHSWTVKIVDYSPESRTTIDLSQAVFQRIAPFTMGTNIISIEYTPVDGEDVKPPPPSPPSGPYRPAKTNPAPPQTRSANMNGTSPKPVPSVVTDGGGRSRKNSIIAASLIGIVTLAVCTTAIYYMRLKKKKKQQQAIIELEANQGPVSYDYPSIKRMIGPQREKAKLGEGGFGAVYRGTLPGDGSAVAVKLLNDAKGSGYDFINEVKCISRTSHNNCIKLLGYCVKKGKRALIYELMPRGSLEKFIHDENQSEAYTRLGWFQRYEIALGIAGGLQYLHEGCKPAILHLDIKPHNILLDQDFTPKLSDFGLAKLCSGDRTTISTKHAKGTQGYIAPEVQQGHQSTKGDVYSYGMLLLEIVGGRRNIDYRADNSKEIFSFWVQKRLDLKEDLELYGITNPEEKEIARKMILVGLNCIQSEYTARPPMRKVLEMLNKRSEELPVPPNPLRSPGAMPVNLPSSLYPQTTSSVPPAPGTQPSQSFHSAVAQAPSFNVPATDGESSYSYTPAKEDRPTNPFLE